MRLDVRNTALVVDSTADFPRAPQRFPNWRVVPLYVRFGDQSFTTPVTAATSASGSLTPIQPSGAETLAGMVGLTRPQAELEIVTQLGPVVGAHSGPATVGFFWFEDADSDRS